MRRVVVGLAWAAVVACGGITERQIDERDPSPPSAGTGGKSSSPAGGQVAGKASSNGGASGTGSNMGAAGTTTIHPPTRASGAACFNDTDCPNPACGGEVCNWNKPNPQPVGDKPYTCEQPGSDAKGMEGWCTTDSNCKCQVLGAKCAGVHCVFTQPGDAPSQ